MLIAMPKDGKMKLLALCCAAIVIILISFIVRQWAAASNCGNNPTPRQKDTSLVTIKTGLGNHETIRTEHNAPISAPQEKFLQTIPPNGKAAKMLRPEDRGADFTQTTATVLLDCLYNSFDKIERHKVAKVLGDRALGDNLQLDDHQKWKVEKIIDEHLNTGHADPSEWSESRSQIERLWVLARPVVLSRIKRGKIVAGDMTFNCAIMLRDENMITEIIEEAKRQTDKRIKFILIRLLVNMNQPMPPVIDGRESMNAAKSQEVCQRLVVPALKELRTSFPEERDEMFILK